MQMTYAKVRPKKNVVTGPAYLVVEDVPLPLAVPFFFFPFSSSYQSGFLMPTYMDDSNRGFGLTDGGYYFAISDQMDLKLRADIFTKRFLGAEYGVELCEALQIFRFAAGKLSGDQDR